MSDDKGLICAYLMDGAGGGSRLDWQGVEAWNEDQGVLWVHLDRTEIESRRWLREDSGLQPEIIDSLLAKGSRPRAMAVGDSLLLYLRGVNLNVGEDPLHMVSVRMFASASRIITVRRQHLMAVKDVQDAIERGEGPSDPAQFLVHMAAALTDRMHPMLSELQDELEQLEDEMEDLNYGASKPRLAHIQRQSIELRRYLAPQRDALRFLCETDIEWLRRANHLRLYGIVDQITRYVENLDAGKEQALVLHEQISDTLSEKMNRNMYLLSVLAGIFLPLDFVTGLLGVNIGGIPGTDSHWGFPLLLILLFSFGAVLIMMFHRFEWLRPIQRASGR
ncbi:MAG: zinc transporter ZntB [Pseudomonadota bacterium]